MSSVTPDAIWIDQPGTLASWFDRLPAHIPIGLDTEFIRRRTFYTQLALLQLSCNDQYALVDPLALDLKQELPKRLGNTTNVVLMHSASEDLDALAPVLPDGPGQLFDTQIGAAFAGMGIGMSYRALVSALVNTDLDKSQTQSDWMQRPLTSAQLTYATLDVVYLDAIHDRLTHLLRQRDYGVWHAEDCERLRQRAREHEINPQPQRAFRNAAEWPDLERARLRRILLWREHRARSLNCPKPWLLDDALALELARNPSIRPAMLAQRSRHLRALRTPQCSELLDLLTTPLSGDDVAATAPIPGIPKGSEKHALKAMKQRIEEHAIRLDLPAGLLCPRKVLELYVVTRQWPAFLQGWRREVLQDDLTTMLPD